MPLINITVAVVEKLLNKLNPYKAPGPNNLQPRILRELNCQIAPVLCNTFKVSLRTGTVPDDWKLANVTPIHKKGSRQLPENYRPVSLTCICCKLMEHILVSRISKHLDRYGILNDSQYGFMRARSCETQLIAFIDDLSKEMQGEGQTDVIVMDFSKAFDKVPHNGLLYKLFKSGIDNITLQWLKRFLEKRRQSVVLEGEHSYSVPVTSGVPQGSVLGPLMFLIFVNDLPCYVKSRVRLFADDTVIYLTIKSESDCRQLQDDLHSLEKWESDWCMECNPSKCHVIRVTRRRTPFKFQNKLHGKVLETADTTKYLRINLSHDLRWNDHVNEITTKANKTLNFLRRNLRTCLAKFKEQAYIKPL